MAAVDRDRQGFDRSRERRHEDDDVRHHDVGMRLRAPVGEEGILVGARARSRHSAMIRVSHAGVDHGGLFVWEGPPAAAALVNLLNDAAGRPTHEVGDLEIPERWISRGPER